MQNSRERSISISSKQRKKQITRGEKSGASAPAATKPPIARALVPMAGLYRRSSGGTSAASVLPLRAASCAPRTFNPQHNLLRMIIAASERTQALEEGSSIRMMMNYSN